MTPELFQTLLRWLASDDPVQVAHATWRLAQPDVLTPAPVEDDVARAIRLTREFPPTSHTGNPCGPCPDR